MAAPACTNHPETPGDIIVSFLDPSVEEPTITLCAECVAPMAATLLQAYTGRDVMAWLFAPMPDEEVAANDEDVLPKKKPAKARKPKLTPVTNGPTSPLSDEVPTDTADETVTTNDEVAVASTAE